MKLRHYILTFAVVISSACSLAGEPFPPGFFKFRKVINPDPSYYPQLSPNEFATLKPGPVYYAFILDAWATRPIPSKPYFSLEMPQYVPDKAVRLQEYVFENMRNPLERSNTAAQLAQAGNKTAAEQLRRALKREADIDAAADLLQALCDIDADVPEKEFAPYLKSKHKYARLSAWRLYAVQDYAKPRVLLAPIRRQGDPQLQAACAAAAVSRVKNTTIAEWTPLLQHPEPQVRAAAVQAVLAFPQASARQQQLLKLCRDGDARVRLALARHCPGKLGLPLLQALAEDAVSSVRAETANAIGRLRHPRLLPVLLKLAQDRRPNVRWHAARSLRQFPGADAFVRLVAMAGDRRSPLTRNAAVDSLSALAGRFDVEAQCARYLAHRNPDIRMNLFRVLAAIGSRRHNPKLQQLLPGEKRPENIAACVQALVAGGAQPAEPVIMALAEHEAPEVRAAVAAAVGALDLKSGYPVIADYLQNDPVYEVRKAAAVSMGQLADSRFAKAMLSVLKRTNYSGKEFLTGPDRANVCWAVSRMPNPGSAILKRLKELIMRMVIKTPLGPSYDSNHVRVSAAWALATIGKRTNDKKVLSTARTMIGVLRRNSGGMAGRGPPEGPELRAYGYQAAQFLSGNPMEQQPLALTEFKFSLRPAKEKRR